MIYTIKKKMLGSEKKQYVCDITDKPVKKSKIKLYLDSDRIVSKEGYKLLPVALRSKELAWKAIYLKREVKDIDFRALSRGVWAINCGSQGKTCATKLASVDKEQIAARFPYGDMILVLRNGELDCCFAAVRKIKWSD